MHSKQRIQDIKHLAEKIYTNWNIFLDGVNYSPDDAISAAEQFYEKFDEWSEKQIVKDYETFKTQITIEYRKIKARREARGVGSVTLKDLRDATYHLVKDIDFDEWMLKMNADPDSILRLGNYDYKRNEGHTPPGAILFGDDIKYWVRDVERTSS